MDKISEDFKTAVEYYDDEGRIQCRTYSKDSTVPTGMRKPAELDVWLDSSSEGKMEKVLSMVETIRSASQLVETHFVLDATKQTDGEMVVGKSEEAEGAGMYADQPAQKNEVAVHITVPRNIYFEETLKRLEEVLNRTEKIKSEHPAMDIRFDLNL